MPSIQPTKNIFWKIALLTGFLVLIILSFYIINFSPITPESMKVFFEYLSNNQGDWGTFGDYIGGTLNPLFGFFGFMALLATLDLQRKQIEEQRKEMQAQRASLAISNKTQIKQQFEGTFFNLLQQLQEQHRCIARMENFPKPGDQLKYMGFERIGRIYQAIFNGRWDKTDPNLFALLGDSNTISQYTQLDDKLNLLFSKAQPTDFHYYFQLLKLMLISIDNLDYPDLENLTIKDKNFYVELLLNGVNEDVFAVFYFYFRKDADIVKLILNLGCLRFSKFLESPDHQAYHLLQDIYGENAFKKIPTP